MTIPSRPAPPPPTSTQNIAARLHQQQQPQQQQQQQHQLYSQNGGVAKLTIKLPPPLNSRGGGVDGVSRCASSASSSSSNSSSYTHNNNNNNASKSITRKFPHANIRYTPATNWDGSPFEPQHAISSFHKKVPPPRPPPPKTALVAVAAASRQKHTQPPPQQQSVNILTNIFNRKKSTKVLVNPRQQLSQKSSSSSSSTGRLTPNSVVSFPLANNFTNSSSSSSNNNNNNTNSFYGSANSPFLTKTTTTTSFSSLSISSIQSSSTNITCQQESQLISFDSPPSSPTFTQKSNSDCLSVDSFSSDSNFSSPNNGSASQPESGFEDDFSASRATASPLDPWDTLDAFGEINSCSYGTTSTSGGVIGTAPVRNLSTINNRIQNSNDNPLCNGKSLLPPAPSLSVPTIIKPKISQKPKAPKPPLMLIGDGAAISNFVEEDNGQLATPPSPPMPNCPPPPPPPPTVSQQLPTSTGGYTMLDVISGKIDIFSLDPNYNAGAASGGFNDVDQNSPPYGIALYDFEGTVDGDLCFREHEKIYILEKMNDEWLRGRTRSGCEGIFPANYIDVKVPLSEPTSTTATKTTATSISSSSVKIQTKHAVKPAQLPKVRCLYTFVAEEPDDLSFKENDMVTILHRINEDWLYGEVDGRHGQFPSNFLEYIPDNLPMP